MCIRDSQWQNRTWYVSGNFVMSEVSGSEDAISRTQSSITHLFDRVDADHLDFDPSKRRLSGTGGNLQFGRASGNWRFETGGTWGSPELELNDLGFQLRSDDFRYYSWLSYRTTKPLEKIRSFQVNHTQLLAYDFGGNLNEMALNMNGWVHLNSNWWINGRVNYKPVNFSNFALRGGPRLRSSQEIMYRQGVISDSRKKFRFTANHQFTTALDDSYRTFQVDGTITYQPTNALQVSLSPTYTINRDQFQYVSELDFNGVPRYLNGQIDQRTLQFPLRVDYIITPDVSIQYWGQPYISRGRYKSYKLVDDPVAKVFEDRFISIGGEQLADIDGSVSVDEDLNGEVDYSFFRPDFSFVQWRSNLVLRWEYIPGSELFAVWTQDVTRFGNTQDSLFQGLRGEILNNKPQNIFLIKATYRFMK